MDSFPTAPPARVPSNVHPFEVADFQPAKALKPPSMGTAKTYGSLDDDSTYSEYAWEFLRRNRFYQAMVDKRTVAFQRDDWQYRPSAAHEAGFGLKHVKHYTESHEDGTPDWTPIAAMTDRMQEAIMRVNSPRRQDQPSLEYPDTQVAVVFDLAPLFGPGTVALRTQADLAVKYLERLLIERAKIAEKRAEFAAKAKADVEAETLTPVPGASESTAEPTYRPKKELLRGYLRLADLLSYPKGGVKVLPKAMTQGTRTMYTLEEAAMLLPDYDVSDDKREKVTNAQRLDRARRYADKAWRLIYGWECLSLLKFEERPLHQR